MNIINKIVICYRLITNTILLRIRGKALVQEIATTSNRPRIYLFCTPTNESNLGDQAQLICWEKKFAIWYPNYQLICIPTRFRQFETLRIIRRVLQKEDMLFVHSGYLIYDPHPELPFILDIVRAFYDRPITILPQTINLKDQWLQQIVAKQFNDHSNLTLICRDEISYYKAQTHFPRVKIKLLPDVVTTMIGEYSVKSRNGERRNGVVFCLRNDGERLYTDEEVMGLRKRLKGIKIEVCDTKMKMSIRQWEKDKNKGVLDFMDKLSRYQVVVTDRYHGLIFSQIVNTPVVILSSADHKLSSGVKWFPQEHFGKNVFYADNLDNAYRLIMDVLRSRDDIVPNPSYFNKKYYQDASALA